MGILICCQGLFDGTDYLLERFWTWLDNKGIEAVKYVPKKSAEPVNEEFDLIVLPSSQIHYLLKAKRNKVFFKKCWCGFLAWEHSKSLTIIQSSESVIRIGRFK